MKIFSEMQMLAMEYGCQLINENTLVVGFKGLSLEKDIKPQIDSIIEEMKLLGAPITSNFPEIKGKSDYVKAVLKNIKAIYTINVENFQKFLEKLHQISDSIKADEMFTALDEDTDTKVEEEEPKTKPKVTEEVMPEKEEAVEELSAEKEEENLKEAEEETLTEVEEETPEKVETKDETEEEEVPKKKVAVAPIKKASLGKEDIEALILKKIVHGAIFYDDFAKDAKGVSLEDFKKICIALCKKNPQLKYNDDESFIYK